MTFTVEIDSAERLGNVLGLVAKVAWRGFGAPALIVGASLVFADNVG